MCEVNSGQRALDRIIDRFKLINVLGRAVYCFGLTSSPNGHSKFWDGFWSAASAAQLRRK